MRQLIRHVIGPDCAIAAPASIATNISTADTLRLFRMSPPNKRPTRMNIIRWGSDLLWTHCSPQR
jgi:hypothetical protein